MFLVMALVGFYKGVWQATGSKDAQWYPASLLAKNIDLYNYYLEHFNEWFMRSVPNYYFQFYYLLQPISYVSWDTFKLIWFLINCLLLLIFLIQIKKDFNFGYRQMAIIFLPFFMGYPLILSLENGQSSILILILTYFAWKCRDNKILLPILLSLLTLKYSFGIPIIFGFLLMGYYRSVILSGLITMIFPLVYSLQFKLNFVSTIFLPLKVNTIATARPLGSGPSDLMSLHGLLTDEPLMGINTLTIGLIVFLALFTFITIKFHLNERTIFICSILFSLFGFYHFGHDYILFLLILPFLYRFKYFKILFGFLILFCYSPRIIRLLDIITSETLDVREFMRNKYLVIFNVCFLIFYFFLLIVNDIQSKNKSDSERDTRTNGKLWEYS